MLKNKKLRIARPTRGLKAAERFYCRGLGLKLLGKFEDHDGVDGIMLGHPDNPYHFEFTHHRHSPIQPTPTKEDLIVFYVSDGKEWNQVTENLTVQGFRPVESLNPYWDRKGKTYQDPDGYRVVIQNTEWTE